jgi:hypothetical protein
MPTFGFELEFEHNTPDVVSYLNDTFPHYLPVGELHRYHCDCMYCSFPGSVLRAQNDSSCAGELISTVFSDMDTARPVMLAIEEAAVEVDAEPGDSAGFHVHVSTDALQTRQLHRSLYQFIRWELVLLEVAVGRFGYMRTMNLSVRQLCSNWITHELGLNLPRRGLPMLTDAQLNDANTTAIRETVYELHLGNDRHSNLNIRTRFDTWEFRLWNSMRVAWRMELACWLSLALLDQDVVRALAETTVPNRDAFQAIINEYNPRAGELLNRQYNSITKISAGEILPREFTLL